MNVDNQGMTKSFFVRWFIWMNLAKITLSLIFASYAFIATNMLAAGLFLFCIPVQLLYIKVSELGLMSEFAGIQTNNYFYTAQFIDIAHTVLLLSAIIALTLI